MLLAMFVGMAVLGGPAAGVLAFTGTNLADVPVALKALGMTVSMTVPMVVWMRHRGHEEGRIAEMAGAMVVPGLGTIALFWANAIPSDAVLALQHVLMISAMVGVMLWRYGYYSRPGTREPT